MIIEVELIIQSAKEAKNMAKKVAVGGEDFVALRRSDSYYVDKTEFLYDLIEKNNNAVTLLTRPRRFGKTLLMSMIDSFLSIFKKDSADVFEGLNIMQHTEFVNKHMNQYPVLFISLKDVEGLNFESAFERMKRKISTLCKKISFIKDSPSLTNDDLNIFERLETRTASIDDVTQALSDLSRMIYKIYDKKTVLLIDEYDVPLAKANSNGYYREMLDLIRGFMSSSLKTNEYLEFAVVTGCLRIPKESIFTGVNNFTSYSVMNGKFSEYPGFTQSEVEMMLDSFGLSDKADVVKKWYDGYHFGNTEVYCPWDVVSYISDLLYDREAKPRNYWENTSSNDAIKAFFDMPEIDCSEDFETLLNGDAITKPVTDSLTYDIAYGSENNLWSLLLMTGYITADRGADYNSDYVALRIPNREITNIFKTAVVDHFNQTVDQTELQSLMNALWSGDSTSASEVLSELLWNTISYMDYHEDYYHAFLSGIFVGRGGYIVNSNKERGLGRPDIDLRDKRNRRAIIIEAKKSDKASEMERDCDNALKQIAEKRYADKLEGYRNITCYGVAFYKKTALVKKL